VHPKNVLEESPMSGVKRVEQENFAPNEPMIGFKPGKQITLGLD
jgi:hypothetical protein